VPLEHIVWLKPKPGTAAETLDALLDEVRGLVDEVPGIIQISAGRNISDRAQGCTHGAVITLENAAALEPYLTHPRHQAVGGRLREAAELLVFDYEH
jgi:heme-degrading monooxygenase HmoA